MADDHSRSITHWRAGLTGALTLNPRGACAATLMLQGVDGKNGNCVCYQIVGATMDMWRINVKGKLSDELADTMDLGG